jgi:protein-disulfide isomerase
MKQKTLFILTAVILLLAFALGTLLYTGEKQEETTQTAALNQASLLRMHSPTLGAAEARVLIVEFFDPACETCRDFYPFVKQLMDAHPGRVRLAMRYTPFHEGSDQAVKVLEAARRQGKYWETLEALYAAQETWVIHHRVEAARMWDALGGVGLDLERVRQDMDAPEIAALIAQDLADAETLQVTKTPEFFVNGRPMPSFGHEQLQMLVEAAVAENYRN